MRRRLAVLFAAAALITPGAAAYAGPGENNPKPQNPPCDADHGHPEENSAQCDDDEEGGGGNGGGGNDGGGNGGGGGGGNDDGGGGGGGPAPAPTCRPGSTTKPPGCRVPAPD